MEKELVDDGLLYRSSNARSNGQAAFLTCSAWLADCYMARGREQEARATFERLLSVRSERGLLSEECNLRARRLCGNYPQALSHLALVTTDIGLCRPVLQREGRERTPGRDRVQVKPVRPPVRPREWHSFNATKRTFMRLRHLGMGVGTGSVRPNGA